MDPIKDAFAKVKQEIQELKERLVVIVEEIETIKSISIRFSTPADSQTLSSIPTIQHNQQESTAHLLKSLAQQQTLKPHSTYNLPYKTLKTKDYELSIGNEGVPADSQTVKQTVQHIRNEGDSALNTLPDVLKSLESIKREVRIKFKGLTKQELTVFTTIYSLEEQGFIVDYSLLSQRLSLTESSIRDYIQRLFKKGVPLIKTRENNKKIFISISSEFKKILSLSSIQKFKERSN